MREGGMEERSKDTQGVWKDTMVGEGIERRGRRGEDRYQRTRA
jgi:hypothetical protein